MANFWFYKFICLLIISCVIADSNDSASDISSTIPVERFEESDNTNIDISELNDEKETHSIQTESSRILDLIINFVYLQKEVFLRELLSNASDALEKMRLKQYTSESKNDNDIPLMVRINVDPESKTISIIDTGIGMTKNDLINLLGTIAKSGTSNFLEALGQTGDANLIGQFGVGFYAAFLVSDKVTVTSKSDDDEQYIWESKADSSFVVVKDPRGNTLGRGTSITLHLKEDASEFLESKKIKDLIYNYSQFIGFPIYMKEQSTITEEVPAPVDPEADPSEEPKVEKVDKQVTEWKQLNTQKAIWMRSPKDVTWEEYCNFYKSTTKAWSNPLAEIHFNAEGEIDFKALLFIPDKAPTDMYNSYFSSNSGVKLYVRRVLVNDNFDDLLPKYLSFIKGVVDSDDLPLNVSREQLQLHKVTKVISKKLVRKVVDTIKRMHSDSMIDVSEIKEQIANETDENIKKSLEKRVADTKKFDKFWTEFKKNIKLGCFDDDTNRSKLAKILQFNSSKTGPNKMITFEQYIQNAPEQKSIYYASASTYEQAMSIPQIQIYIKRGIEVLFMLDTMDEPCIGKINEFEGHKLLSIQKSETALPDKTEEETLREKKLVQMYKPLTKWLEEVVKNKASSVRISSTLVNDPCAVVSSQWGHSAQMEKLMKAQTFTDSSQVAMMAGSKTFEINPNHPIIVDMLTRITNNENDPIAKETAIVLFQTALLSSGYEIENPKSIITSVYQKLYSDLGVDPNTKITDVDVSSIPDEVASDNITNGIPEIKLDNPEGEMPNFEEFAKFDQEKHDEL